MMKCKEIRKIIPVYFEEPSKSEIRKLVDQHVNVCLECDIIFHQVQLLEKYAIQNIQVRPDPYLATRVVAAMNRENEGINFLDLFPVRRRGLIVSVITMLAVFIGVKLGSVVVEQGNNNADQQGNELFLEAIGGESVEYYILQNEH